MSNKYYDVDTILSNSYTSYKVEITEGLSDFHNDKQKNSEPIDFEGLTYAKPGNIQSLSIPPMDSFKKIALTMTPLDDTQLIFKRQLNPGFGPTVTPGQNVFVHYVMYHENTVEPFDSTVLKGRPSYLKTGIGKIMIGLENAIFSMKVREIAVFIIDWKLAFLELGCSPRIPPKALICCYIEIIKIVDDLQPVQVSGECPTVEDSFQAKIDECEKMVELGKSLMLNRKFSESIRKMGNALRVLQSLTLQNEEEQQKMETLLIRTAVNLAAVYNHCNQAELACDHCKIALRINPRHQRALFNFGRAKIRLNDFSGAEKLLSTGMKLYPDDKTFPDELNRLKAKQADIASRQKLLKVAEDLTN